MSAMSTSSTAATTVTADISDKAATAGNGDAASIGPPTGA